MTSAYSPGFTPIFQKFHEIICEINFSKTACGIFQLFCRSCFINNFVVKNNFSKPQNPKAKYLENNLFSVPRILSAQISRKDFFKIFFQVLRTLFKQSKEGMICWNLTCKKNTCPRRFQNPVEHLRWSFLQKQLTAVNPFNKKIHHRCSTRF